MRMPAGLKRRPGRRVLGGTLIVTAALGISIPLGLANLPNSTFDAGDGNLVLNDSGGAPNEDLKDWENAPDLRIKTDASETAADDSYAGGEKHDDVCPTAKTGSIPPNKDDLTRLYVSDETVGQDVFVYMAWERFLDKNSAASAHMSFEFNRFRAACAAPSKNVVRTAGDVLLLMDLEGGGNPVFELLRWQTAAPVPPATGCKVAAGPPCWGNAKVLGAAAAEGQVNRTAPITDPVLAPGQTLPRTLGFNHMFGEAAVNLTAAGVFTAGDCEGFGSAMLLSRSAGNSFQSTLKDFVGPLDVDITNCGALNVHKYIDIDESGTESLTNNETTVGGLGGVTAADLTGWNVTVTGPNSFSCTGTTDAAGVLTSCLKAGVAVDLTRLAPGSYTVTENGPLTKTIGSAPGGSAFFNTDPGTAPATPPVSESVTVVVGQTASVNLGNSCYATARFELTNVPSGQSGLFVRYTVNGGAAQEVNLAQDGATANYKASVGSLRKGNVIAWSYGINRGTANEQTKAVTDPFTLNGYPNCSGSGSKTFDVTTINGSKFKDVNGNGVRNLSDTPTLNDGPLRGFEFELRRGTTGSGTVVGTSQRSAENGTFAFADIAPGTYTIHEINRPSGWQQTTPASNGFVTVTVNLGDPPVTADPFGNTPLSKVQVNFLPQAKLLNLDGTESATSATKATSISCTDPADPTAESVGSSTNSNTLTTDNAQIKQSSVTCVITYEDP